MSKSGKVILISGSVIAVSALLVWGYKKIADYFEILDFDNYI